MRAWLRCLPVLCLLAGCQSEDGAQGLSLVAGNPFGAPPPPVVAAKLPPATSDASFKVDYVSRKLLAANKQVGLKPYFMTVGSPTPEIFHIDTKAIYVTEGLVNRCKTEEDLAAVLARELGRMVTEREILASEDYRERLRPIDVPIGNASQGAAPDKTGIFELVKRELEPQRPVVPRPNPQLLAGNYLDKAGYTRSSLETAKAIFDEAEANCALERQLKGMQPKNPWTP